MTEPTSTTADQPADQPAVVNARVLARAFTALRIFTGLVWLSNGLAKLFDVGTIDLGFFSGSLITKGAAQSIATGAAQRTGIAPLGAFYRDVVLPNWSFFGVFLTVAELAIGIGLIFGIATRLAAVGGLLLIGPIWIMLWHAGGYLWEYPAEDLVPLVLLAVVPAGRTGGFDRRLAPRFGHHWPF
jgi:thiosulfate dehydrogenase (quinone) large subunit